MTETLNKLLQEGTRFNPSYLPSMNSDHLPMSLVAMAALGAPASALVTYQTQYAARLHEAPPSPDLDLNVTWQDCASRHHFSRLRSMFDNALAERPAEQLAAEVLEQTLDGLAADAFHPLIRLGYALEAQHTAEIAAALAYMVSTYTPMPLEPTHLSAFGFDSLEGRLKQQCDMPTAPATRFGDGLRDLVANGQYPVGTAHDLNECAYAALSVYRSTRNFFALHMVTATWAARICSRVLATDHQARLLAALTGALLAAHQIVGAPRFDAEAPIAVSQPDTEHLYKYLYVCRQESKLGNDPRYLTELQAFHEANMTPAWLEF